MATKIGIVGFPQDIGASRRGVDMGPYALRAEGLIKALESLGLDVRDYGNIACLSMESIEDEDGHPAENEKLRYLEPIRHNLVALRDRVRKICNDGRLPLVIGGDHSQSIGTIAGLQEVHGKNLGLMWVDAHGDFNTPETTPSGNIHGMPLAVVTGRGASELLAIGNFPGVTEQAVAVFGARDIDPGEMDNFKNSKITLVTSRHIVEEGFKASFDRAINAVINNCDKLHLSFDMDSIDPIFCPGTGTAVPGGLTNREALYIMERMFASGKVIGIDLVEVNPALDHHNQTGLFAVELICRSLGKKSH